MKSIFYILLLFFVLSSCKKVQNTTHSYFKANNELLRYQGRTEIRQNKTAALIGSASSVSISFSGTYCDLILKSESGLHNYINLELDGKYQGRFKIENGSAPFRVTPQSNAENHIVTVFKATEAASGAVLFEGLETGKVLSLKSSPKKLVEFIGNSITCGALSDPELIPCGEGEYLDQHNAYLSYGPRIARALNVDFILSSVSGIGIYRNWNDENIDEPVMPQVYENLYLNTDDSKPFDFSHQPAVVSICLGTNDLSEGDGKKERLAFNSEKYTANYISFVKTLYRHYPDTKIILLNSPMVAGEKNDVLVSCLKKVQSHFKDKEISIYQFEDLYVNGCSYHPSINDHQIMAELLTPVFRDLLID